MVSRETLAEMTEQTIGAKWFDGSQEVLRARCVFCHDAVERMNKNGEVLLSSISSMVISTVYQVENECDYCHLDYDYVCEDVVDLDEDIRDKTDKEQPLISDLSREDYESIRSRVENIPNVFARE